MSNDTILAITVAVVVIVAAAAVMLYFRGRRTHHLRSRFGPAYDRAVEDGGGRSKAEAGLQKLEKRVAKFDIRDLSTIERERFVSSWRDIQADFVDNPDTAVSRADQLLAEVMQTRGYPVGDFEQQAADLSVDHPVVVENYRAAHAIAPRKGSAQTTTEDLRQAMVHFRTLFDDLAGSNALAAATAR